MREIYKPKNIRSVLTQGSIINKCLASDYPDSEVWGIIITPRCDLAREIKVSTIHYLPIVDFECWYKVDGLKIIYKRELADIKSKLNSMAESFLNIKNICSQGLTKENYNKLLESYPKSKEKEKFQSVIEEFFYINAVSICNYSPKDKIKKKVIQDLLDNNLASFYFIEDWNRTINVPTHKVIILREVKSFDRDIAKKLTTGFIENEYDSTYIVNNNLKTSNGRDNIYNIITELNSPFIEHIIQGFSHNFCRIGVDDIEKENISTDLLSKIRTL